MFIILSNIPIVKNGEGNHIGGKGISLA